MGRVLEKVVEEDVWVGFGRVGGGELSGWVGKERFKERFLKNWGLEVCGML